MSEPTCLPASIVADTIMRTIEHGVTITDAALDDQVTVVFCDLLVDGPGRCPSCSQAGTYRDTIVRTVTDLPVAGHPLQFRVRVPRYRCVSASCEREVFRHNTDRLARPGWSTTRRCARHVLRRLMIDRTSIAAIARELGLSWDTVNAIAVDATTGLLAADTARLDSVRVIGVDEHRWAHTRRAAGDGYVTVIVDLTPVFDGTGTARLLDLVPGRSSAVLTTWLDRQSAAFRDRIEVVAMVPREREVPPGFGGYKHAATSHVRRCGDGDGSVPRRRPGRGEAGSVPSARAAAHPRAPGSFGGSALRGSSQRPHPAGVAHRPATLPPRGGVRRGSASAVRGHVAGLSGRHRCLRRPRPSPWQEETDPGDRHDSHRRP
nr:transposase family protein [Rhodococcus ruber]